jgi:four helix bundle protein
MGFSFEELRVWQKAVKLSKFIFEVSTQFPKEETFILKSQIQRAADSVALNIAEGSTGQTKKEFQRFLGIAIRSGVEVITCLYLAKSREIISDENFSKAYSNTEELIKQIQALRKSLNN